MHIALLLLIGSTLVCLGQGRLLWKPRGESEKENFVYLVKLPCDSESHRERIEGSNFYAQIWYATGGTASEESLVPLSGVGQFNHLGLIHFKQENYQIFGTYGGDRISLQLRVWENQNQTLTSWEDALADVGNIHGSSPLVADFGELVLEFALERHEVGLRGLVAFFARG